MKRKGEKKEEREKEEQRKINKLLKLAIYKFIMCHVSRSTERGHQGSRGTAPG